MKDPSKRTAFAIRSAASALPLVLGGRTPTSPSSSGGRVRVLTATPGTGGPATDAASAPRLGGLDLEPPRVVVGGVKVQTTPSPSGDCDCGCSSESDVVALSLSTLCEDVCVGALVPDGTEFDVTIEFTGLRVMRLDVIPECAIPVCTMPTGCADCGTVTLRPASPGSFVSCQTLYRGNTWFAQRDPYAPGHAQAIADARAVLD